MTVRRQPATTPIDPFSQIDDQNVHVAIAAGIAEELRKTYPKIHFQVFGPCKNETHPTHANISFIFTLVRDYCGKSKQLPHSGTIVVSNGECRLEVTDPANLMYDAPLLVQTKYPLEIPNFPEVLYEALTVILEDATGPLKESGVPVLDRSDKNSPMHGLFKHCLDATMYLNRDVANESSSQIFEITLEISEKKTFRHLTDHHHNNIITTFCGLCLDRTRITKVQQLDKLDNFCRDSKWCSNCRVAATIAANSKTHKEK